MSIILREKRKLIKMEISNFVNCTALQIEAVVEVGDLVDDAECEDLDENHHIILPIINLAWCAGNVLVLENFLLLNADQNRIRFYQTSLQNFQYRSSAVFLHIYFNTKRNCVKEYLML